MLEYRREAQGGRWVDGWMGGWMDGWVAGGGGGGLAWFQDRKSSWAILFAIN